MQRKVALITGASHGVGRAISIALARDGYSVALLARSRRELEVTASRIRKEGREAEVYATDISRPADLEHIKEPLVRRFGRLDAMVHCAFGHIGEDDGKSLLHVATSQLEDFGRTSVLGAWYITRLVAPLLRKFGGRAVYVIADWGLPQHNIMLTTGPSSRVRIGSEVFVSAKYAVAGLAVAMERSLAIPTTGIYPGIIASARQSARGQRGKQRYFDLDDPEAAIDAEPAYRHGWAIPLSDVTASVLLALHSKSCVRAISLKPLTPDYEGLHAAQ